jgi:P-type Mg2+ transporter
MTGGSVAREAPHPATHWFARLCARLRTAEPAAYRATPEEIASGTQLLALASVSDVDALAQLGTDRRGLTDTEAAARLAMHGPNTVAHETERGALAQLARRLVNPLNLLLIALSVVSAMTGGTESAIVITAMVLLSVSLSFVQEHRSKKAAAALRALVHTTATVVRRVHDGASGALEVGEETSRDIPIAELVPGDIVRLSAGDMIPADIRLLTEKDLYVNQSALTGEALPVEKTAAAQSGQRDAVQLTNICFMGTNVVSGSATGVVVHTGAHAMFGRIAELIVRRRAPTSFDVGIARFTWMMIGFIAVMAPLVFVINGLTKHDWLEALLFATAVAVGLTPEMLPMIVTVNLSKGALAMARKSVIVKRLNAIQNFGAMDVLCTDKTGTLTQDRIIVEKYIDLAGNESRTVLEYAYLNSYYQSGLKNLLDVAVLRYVDVHASLHERGVYTKIDEVPFDFERRRMSVVVQQDGKRTLICKGAVEEMIAASSHGEIGSERFALDAGHIDALKRESEDLNEDGFRVIAIATKPVPSTQHAFCAADEAGLTLLGYVAFLDPPKESARDALCALAAHGVSVRILTGDNAIVTRKVCREIGLDVGRVVLGAELDALDAQALGELVETTRVFAKLSPTHKSRVIEGLRRRGHVVGFLGDGINDAPALKAADVGISVDSAVDIAKESADIILLKKNLLVLDDGVIEGRKTFVNVIKYLRMGASSNFGNMFSVLGASAWLPFVPMAPIQVLTNNLLYDFSQTAIPTDNVDAELLAAPRRWEIGNIARFMLLIGPISSLFDYATFGWMVYGLGARTAEHAALFQSGWFLESILSQTLIIHVIRTAKVPFVESRPSLPLMVTSGVVCALGIWLPFSPLADALGLVRLPWGYWPAIVLFIGCYLILTHAGKRFIQRRFGIA